MMTPNEKRELVKSTFADYCNATFAYDWSQAVMWYAEVELSLHILQPVEFRQLEAMYDASKTLWEDAYAEYDFYATKYAA